MKLTSGRLNFRQISSFAGVALASLLLIHCGKHESPKSPNRVTLDTNSDKAAEDKAAEDKAAAEKNAEDKAVAEKLAEETLAREQCEAAGKSWSNGACHELLPVVPPQNPERVSCELNALKQWLGGICIDKFTKENTLYTPQDHCEKKPSGAYAACKVIPRPNLANISAPVIQVSPTENTFINKLNFVSRLTYIYFCPGGNMPAVLTNGLDEYPLVQEQTNSTAHTISQTIALNNRINYSLKIDAKAFSTISKDCIIAITNNETSLQQASQISLKKQYIEAHEEAIKKWLELEMTRVKNSTPNDYSKFLESLLES